MSDGGVGRLMRRLEPLAVERGYKVLSRRMVPLRPLLAGRRYFRLALELLLRLISLIVFKFNIFFIKESTCLVLHPQSIGNSSFLRLVRNNNVYLYVMDSSFFCMMSYNYNMEQGTECLRCVANPRNSLSSCYSWPSFYSKKAAVDFLEQFQSFQIG